MVNMLLSQNANYSTSEMRQRILVPSMQEVLSKDSCREFDEVRQ